MKTILITGCSTGFGLETARYFLRHDWKVIATMRTPRADLFAGEKNARVLPLDVTNAESIRSLVESAGPIDALVNNAGVGLLGTLEGTSLEAVRATFETNLFGAIAVTKAFVPQMRERKSGVIVNVSSTTTLEALPLLSFYTASKAAMNAYTECLALELEPFGVRVRLVLPGMAPDTAFGKNAFAHVSASGVEVPPAYAAFTQQVVGRMQNYQGPVTRSVDVAEAIWRAVTDPASPLRQPAGEDAVALAKAVGRSA